MADRTPRLGLTTLGPPGDTVDADNFKFGAADRHLLDQLLARAAESHTHDGAAAAAPPALAGPQVDLGTTTGRIPAGARVYYRYALVDTRGHETQASPAAHAQAPNPIPAPSWWSLTTIADGTLPAGNYSYAISAYTGAAGNETLASTAKLSTLATEGGTRISGPSSPESGESGYTVYRRGPADEDFHAVGSFTVAEGSINDDGSRPPALLSRRPTGNTSFSTNSREVALPTELPDGYLWRLYRTYNQANWAASLIYTGTETPFTDTGAQSRPGTPASADTAMSSPPKVGLTDMANVAGTLPPGLNVTSLDATLTFEWPFTVGASTWVWLNEYLDAAIVASRAVLGRNSVPATNSAYPLSVDEIVSGAVDLVSDTIEAQMVDATYGYDPGHEFLVDVPSGARISAPVTLAAKAMSGGWFVATVPPFTSVAAGDTVTGLVIYLQTGSDATARLLDFKDRDADGALISIETNGASVDFTFGLHRVFKVSP